MKKEKFGVLWLVKKSVFRLRVWNVSSVIAIALGETIHNWIVSFFCMRRIPVEILFLNFSVVSLFLFSVILMRIKGEYKSFALMKVFGATNFMISKFVVLELFIVALVGILLGEAVSFLVFGFLIYIGFVRAPMFMFSFVAGVVVIFAILSVLSWIVMIKIDPYVAIKK